MFKKIKEVKDECPICEKKRSLLYGKRNEVVNVRGEKIPVTANVYHCAEGDHYFYDPKDEDDKYQTAYREFRHRKGLLQPEDIRQLRMKYGLSQRAFARLIGCSSITIQRYETGALQDDVHNNLLLILRDHHSFTHFFEAKKSSLPDKLRRTIEKKLRDFDEEGKQLELDFIFRHARPEAAEVVIAKSANKEASKFLIDVFARLEVTQKFQPTVDIVKMRPLSSYRFRKKTETTNGSFSVNAKGDLALAA